MIRRVRKSKTLKDQVQKQEENEKAELKEIREDNIDAAKRQKSKKIYYSPLYRVHLLRIYL
jgi:hypothetical protein